MTKQLQDSSNAQRHSNRGRRDFLSLSLLAGSTFLLAAESHGQTPLTQGDDLAITSSVGIADSIALYTDLLEDIRRMVLQKDAYEIHVAKFEATEWLGMTTSKAVSLRALLQEGVTLTSAQRTELSGFLTELDHGGNEISRGLIFMRQHPLEEIKNLDTDFDKIRAELTAASNALKNRNPGKAKEGITSAIAKLNKYTPASASTRTYDGSPNNAPPRQQGQSQAQQGPPPRQQGQAQRSSDSASTLRELLEVVLGLLAAPATPSEQHHSRAYANYNPMPTEPVWSEITAVLRRKLNPASWLQVGIGYAVAFPILMRVSDKNNRLKLLNDALRLVPPGLRNPLLEELANDLANLP